jgi:carbamoyltransferase
MKILGINALNHDSSVAVVEDNKILFHKRSTISTELTQDLVDEALGYGEPDFIAWYERPWLKKTRQLYAGQYSEAFSIGNIPSRYVAQFGLDYKIKYVPHHMSHACGAFYTSGLDESAILVADAIGEWETVSIWYAKGKEIKKVWSRSYPYSLGLFYTAFTHLVGLTPVKQEGVLTEMSKQGKPLYIKEVSRYVNENCHIGITDWSVDADQKDIAASVQVVFEEEIKKLGTLAKQLTNSNNIIFTGGCAYNKLAVNRLNESFNNVQVPKFPGDSGSSIGAAASFIRQNL